MFVFLLIIQSLIAIGLITVILMQRSEGGGLQGGGSPSGMMSARGAADFLTRATTILATGFVALSILLAALAAQRTGRTIDAAAVTNGQTTAPLPLPAPAPTTPGAAPFPGVTAPAGNGAAVAPTPTGNATGGVPLAQ